MNEIVISSIIFVVSLFYFISSFSMNADISNYPRGLLIFMMIMSCYLAVRKVNIGKNAQEKPIWVFPEQSKKLIIGALAFIIYIFALNVLGYIISTSIFYFLWLTVIREGTVFKNLLTAGSFILVIYLLFSVFLKVPLPEGIIF